MELLKFIFQSFWTWLGFTVLGCALVATFFEGLATLVKSFTGKYKSADVIKAEVEAAKANSKE